METPASRWALLNETHGGERPGTEEGRSGKGGARFGAENVVSSRLLSTHEDARKKKEGLKKGQKGGGT